MDHYYYDQQYLKRFKYLLIQSEVNDPAPFKIFNDTPKSPKIAHMLAVKKTKWKLKPWFT